MALYYAKKGNPTEALTLIRRARSIDANNVEFIHNQGVIEAIAGRPEDALKSLREAFQKGYPPDDGENDPELKDLRARPEFGNLVKEFHRKMKRGYGQPVGVVGEPRPRPCGVILIPCGT